MDRDFLLIARMRPGDDGAIEEFVGKYYPMILRYCRLHTANRCDAEDLTQETFEKFFRSLGQYQHRGKAANYLYTIAGNACRDFCKKPKEVPLEGLSREMGTEPEANDAHLAVALALDALPPELREAAVLFYIQGLKQREIADLLHISLPLVKYRLGKAKAQLQQILSEEGT